MTKVKICGLRDSKHALLAADSGADYLGFVFVPGVRRCLALGEAQHILTHYREVRGSGGPKIVGLFSNQPIEFVNEVIHKVPLDMIQLSGEESLSYIGLMPLPVIKVIHIDDMFPFDTQLPRVINQLETFRGLGVTTTLDRKSSVQPGGLGYPFDWSIAQELSPNHDFLLAGGLTPDNVAEAIAMVSPWGVDVSSGVEESGIKSVSKISAFIDSVKASAP